MTKETTKTEAPDEIFYIPALGKAVRAKNIKEALDKAKEK